jgi:hypothetical protein
MIVAQTKELAMHQSSFRIVIAQIEFEFRFATALDFATETSPRIAQHAARAQAF